ncbi:MAG: SRPBCC family protein [Polyangiaceae bacterium]
MARKILLGVAALIVVLVIVTLLQPSTYRVERSITTNASVENTFAQVNDFHLWNAWSPWEKMDPGMKKTFEGPATGTGSKYAWSGNDQVGEGRMTIEKSEKPSKIDIKLEFLKPFESTSKTTFAFAPAGTGSKVTWSMEGENNFVGKFFCIFMNMDKMIGGDFEKGLAAMKTAAEAVPAAAPVAAPAAAPAPTAAP